MVKSARRYESVDVGRTGPVASDQRYPDCGVDGTSRALFDRLRFAQQLPLSATFTEV
jgi:hypothetical protein